MKNTFCNSCGLTKDRREFTKWLDDTSSARHCDPCKGKPHQKQVIIEKQIARRKMLSESKTAAVYKHFPKLESSETSRKLRDALFDKEMRLELSDYE